MRKNGFLIAIPKSFYSQDLYRDVVANWGTNILWFLLLVLVVICGLKAIPMQSAIVNSYAKMSDAFLPQVPEMSIKNGILSTPEDRPYEVRDHKTNELFAIIDTSGKYNSLQDAKSVVLVTKDAMYFQSSTKLYRTYVFDSNLNMDIHPDKADKKLKSWLYWSGFILFPVILLFIFLICVVVSALYAIVGEIFSHILKVPLTYGEIFRIAIVASTPAMVLNCILESSHIVFPYMGFLFFILSMVYLWFGVKSNKTLERIIQ